MALTNNQKWRREAMMLKEAELVAKTALDRDAREFGAPPVFCACPSGRPCECGGAASTFGEQRGKKQRKTDCRNCTNCRLN